MQELLSFMIWEFDFVTKVMLLDPI